MSIEVIMESPLAHALNIAIQPKLLEVGWSTGGGDESALSEYIILMLVNGKTQDQIATELSGDLLNLGPDDPGARDFSKWLFEQVDVLNSQLSGNGGADAEIQDTNGIQDADMGDAVPNTHVYAISSVDLSPELPDLRLPPKPVRLTYHRRPTGPKSMRNGGSNRSRDPRDPRDKRMLNHLSKAMDRSNDSPLHRRTQGTNDRINTHRAPPTGPRQQGPARGGLRAINNRTGNQFPQGQPASAIGNMTSQQQMEMMALFEQQARFMQQLMNPEQQQEMMTGTGGGHLNPAFSQHPGKSLFDRVEPNPQRLHSDFRNGQPAHKYEAPSSSMDVEMSSQEVAEKPELDPSTPCKWQLQCTREDCIFAHQSPAAKSGAPIDVSDVCSYGARCTNFKCTGRHPSPAKRLAHALANASDTQCKWDGNCTNKKCPFKHSATPACRNGADCTVPDCNFTHNQTVCKYNPCNNPKCIFKHPAGHKRGKFEDKVWTADGNKEHVSERKFVDENGAEELIVPGLEAGLGQESTSVATELIT